MKNLLFKVFLFACFQICYLTPIFSQTVVEYKVAGNYTWSPPLGTTRFYVELWGGGGGADRKQGGGGGAYARSFNYYTSNVGYGPFPLYVGRGGVDGGDGDSSWFYNRYALNNSYAVVARGGSGAHRPSKGYYIGGFHAAGYYGGVGGAYYQDLDIYPGGGGGSAFSNGNGGNGGNGSSFSPGVGGSGTGNGGNANEYSYCGDGGKWPGGGAGAPGPGCNQAAAGYVKITYFMLPVITSFSPVSGAAGTLVTISGTYFNNPTGVTIGGVNALIINSTSTSITALVMPGATSGAVTVTNAEGTGSSAGNFSVIPTTAPNIQQGSKLVGTGGVGINVSQGYSISLSADGNTAIVGGRSDNSSQGAAWIFTRNGSTWTQQGNKLVGTGAVGIARQGTSVSLSADGNTAIVGGESDNSGQGAAWVFTRSGTVWTQQGSKLVGTGSIGNGNQGRSVSLSADGNTAMVGGYNDNSGQGAAWVFTRTGTTWSQQGSKLVGTGAVGAAGQGFSVSLSADGYTAIVGGNNDNSGQGAAWVFTRWGTIWTQQGNKLVGTGAVGAAAQGSAVSVSANGNTAMVGGENDGSGQGAVWVYTRSGTTWAQQGSKLVGTGAIDLSISQGRSVSLSADGNTAMVGGYYDNTGQGAAWVYTRSGNAWSQKGAKLVGTGSIGSAVYQSFSVSLSADGNTAISGGFGDNNFQGAAWVYTYEPPPVVTTPAVICGSGSAVLNATTGTGTTVDWYNAATGGTLLSSGSLSYTTPVLTATTMYYAQSRNTTTGLVTATRTAVTVTVSPLTATPTISGTLCQGSTLTATPTTGIQTLAWSLNGTVVKTTSPNKTMAGGNGSGSTANQLKAPSGVFVDGSGNVYVADKDNHRVQRWAPGATSGTTVAGGNGVGTGGNQLAYPTGVYVDVSGNVYVADEANHRIQRWAAGATSGITVAGGNGYGSAANQLASPTGVFVDGSGNVYVADNYNHRIQRWAPGAASGTTVAGGNGQGSASNKLAYPTGVFVDGSGKVYVADWYNDRIQCWAPGATEGTTVAGGNSFGSAANQLNSPTGVYVDGSGNVYVADSSNHRIQRWEPNATSGTTVAGGNGAGSNPYQLNAPAGVYVDGSGNVYVADYNNHRIQRFAPDGIFNTLNNAAAGTYAVKATSISGCSATSAAVVVNPLPAAPTVATPSAICGGTSTVINATTAAGTTVDWYHASTGGILLASGALTYTTQVLSATTNYYAQTRNTTTGCVSATRRLVTVTVNPLPAAPTVTTPSAICSGTGTVINATTASETTVDWYSASTGGTLLASGALTYTTPVLTATTIYYAETRNTTSGCVSATRTPVTVTVNPLPATPIISGTLCPGSTLTATPTSGIQTLSWSLNGNVVKTTSAINTVAGGNGNGSNANQFAGASGVYVDGTGNVYVADANNNRIQRWAPGATSGTTVAGGNGAGANANQLNNPLGVYVDGSGNVYVADRDNHRIQRWAPGAISGTTVAGGNGSGSAANKFNYPSGVYVDGSGNVYVSDELNDRVQRWAPGATSGTTVAGGNGFGSAANQFNRPSGVYVDGSGNVYVADPSNQRIQRWAPGATSGTTVAGGNGQGSAANQLYFPNGVYVDGSGNVYVADQYNHRIQRWAPGATSGTTLAGGNGQGSASNQLIGPSGVFVDGSGNMYVADAGNDRIQQFALAGIVNTLDNAAAGTYTVTATSFSGCSATSAGVVVAPPASPVISGALSFCAGTSTTLDAGAGYSSYLWSNGATTRTISVNTSGNFSVTVKNASNCSASSASVTTSIRALPATPVISGTLSFCAGSSTTLDAGAGYSSYLWSNGETTRTISVSTAGNFSVTVKNASNCSASSASVTTSILALPASPVISGALSFCSGSSTTLDAGAGYSSYLWSNGETTRTISVSTAGNFSVTVKNASNCSASSASVTTSILALPATPVISGALSFCSGSSTTLDAGAGYSSYLWSNGESTRTISVNTAGSFSVTVANANGCTAQSAASEVVEKYPSVSVQEATACLSYLWNNITYTNSGTYSYQTTNAAGCDSTATLVLTILNKPAINPEFSGSNGVCRSKTGLVYSIPASAGATSYTWTLPVGMTGSSTSNSITVATSSTFAGGNIQVTANNSCGSSAVAQMALTALTALPVAPASITGSASVCAGSSQTYVCANVTGATYTWTAPANATLTSGQGTNTATFQFSSAYTTGSISVKSINCFGTSTTARTLTVAKKAIPGTVGVITGITAGVCSTESRTYSIVALANTDSYQWTAPSGATISSGQGTTSVVVQFAAGFTTGSLSVKGVNCSGISATARTLALSNVTAAPTVLTGPATAVCAGSTQTYSTTAVAGASTYTWAVPTGATINSGQGTTTISVTFPTPFTSGAVTVKSGTACYTTGTVRSVTVYSAPVTPASITGTAVGVCAGTTQTYTCPVSTTGATTYTWTVPTGAVINSGQGSTSVSVTFPAGFTSGSMSVTAGNACGTSTARTLAVSAATAQPGVITGTSSNLCAGGSFTYSIAAVTGATTYSWTAPAGCTITANTGTSITMTVAAGFTTGTLSVIANSACGASTARTLALTGIPPTPASITGPVSVCASATGLVYSTPVVAGVTTYTWTVPTGAVITAGAATSSITVTWGTVAGSVTVKAGNACGTNATARSLAVARTAGCRGAVEEVVETMSLFPNPASQMAMLTFSSAKESAYSLRVTNTLGQVVYSSEGKANEGTNTIELNLEKLSSGMYIVQLVKEGTSKQVNLIKR